MGVAGSGKSSLGRLLAQRLGQPFIEGDDFHPPANAQKLRSGQPLDDADRAPWLDALVRELRLQAHGAVLACSALRQVYRDRLRTAGPGLRFVYLEIDSTAAGERVAARAARHLFPPQLLASQFATLEPPRNERDVLTLDATRSLADLSGRIIEWIGA